MGALSGSFLHALLGRLYFLPRSSVIWPSSIVFQGVYVPQVPWAGRLPWFHYLDYPYRPRLKDNE